MKFGGISMNTSTAKLAEIHKELTMLPDDKLDEVKNYIESILSQNKSKKKTVVQFKGIWANKGFEKINNIEKEVQTNRNELSESILKKFNT